MKNRIKFDDGSYLVEVTPNNWAQFACRAHTQYGYPDGGKNAALRAASPNPEDIVTAYNEHAALLAVAEAADKVIKANNVLLEAQRQGAKTAIGNAQVELWCELDRLAAIREAKPISLKA